MSVQRYLPVGDVTRRPDARALDPAKVREIRESIRLSPDRQPINPIVVRFLTDGWELLAGGHRLEAMQELGEKEIICTEVDCDDLHAELIVIDENLYRAELSPADRAAQTARRKVIYEELHPTAKAGVSQAAGMNKAIGNVADNLSTTSFAEATADATGRDARSVRRDAERGEKIEPAVLATISASDVKHLKTGAYLDELKQVPRDEQAAKVERDKAEPPAPRTRAPAREAGPPPEAAALTKRQPAGSITPPQSPRRLGGPAAERAREVLPAEFRAARPARLL